MAKKLTENQVAKTYEVVKGFNLTEKGQDVRYDVGADKPNFVYEKDFSPKNWATLLEMGAVRLVFEPEVLKEDETIVFEKVGE